MNQVVDRVFIIEWGVPQDYLGGIQDYFGIDNSGNICSLKIQLLHNSASKILDYKPLILSNIPGNIECLKIKKSDLLEKNNCLDNCRQFLFEDYLIFSYYPSGILNETNLSYIKLCTNLFALFDQNSLLKYIIIAEISQFFLPKFKSILKDKRIIELYFKIYTYNQDCEAEMKDLIVQINNYIQELGQMITNEIHEYLITELETIKEDLELVMA